MLEFCRTVKFHHNIIWSLAKNDFRNRYIGSILGIFWAFLMPLVNLVVMWVAFQYGFRASPVKGIPFILWLVTGMFPWTFFAESMQATSQSIVEKAFLVKKVVFKVELLPLIKITASIILFVFLLVVMMILFMLYGFWPDVYWLQVIYYTGCLCALVLSMSWLTSSVVVFYRDIGQIISMLLQIGFWATPIFWSPDQLPDNLKIFAFLNPVNYVVSGFRESLISKVWFWSAPGQTIYFWCLIAFLSSCGLVLFKKLRPHFADVL